MEDSEDIKFKRALSIYMRDWPESNVDARSVRVGWNLRATNPDIVEAEREAIRQEVRSDIKRELRILFIQSGGESLRAFAFDPPKKRQLTRDEMLSAIHTKWYPGPVADGNFDAVRQLPDSILRTICLREGIALEIEE